MVLRGWCRDRARLLLNVASVCVLAGVVFMTFGQSLKYAFAWDDYGLIVENRSLSDGSSWHSVFFRHFWQVAQNEEDPTRSFYRPLISLSYSLDYAVWKVNPSGYHLTNLLLHTAAASAAFFLLLGMTGTYWTSLLAVILWSIHPARVENVVWVSGRTDLVCGLAYLVALCFLQHVLVGRRQSPGSVVLATFAYGLALLSKETAITFIPLSVLFFLFHPSMKRPDRLVTVLFFTLLGLTTVLYFTLRASILGTAVAPAAFGTWSQRLLSIPMVFIRYLGLSVGLFPVRPHHSEPFVDSIFSMAFMSGTLVTLAFAVVALLLLRRQWKAELLCLLWFPVVLVPVFYLGSFGDVLYADRFLYLPALGLTTCITLLFRRLIHHAPVGRRSMIAALAFIGTGLLMLVYSRAVSRHWENSLTLFQRIAVTSPNSAYVQFNLGNSLARIGAYEEACTAYRKALELHPEYAYALTNYGVALNKLGRYQETLSILLPAHHDGRPDPLALAALADAFAGVGNMQRAIILYRRALMQRPEPWIMQRLGVSLMHNGQLREAAQWLQRAVEQHPGASSYHDWAVYCLRSGRQHDAVRFLVKALDCLEQEVPEAGLRIRILFHLAQSLAATGQNRPAVDHAEQARRLQQQSSVKPFPNGEIERWIASRTESDSK